MIRRYAIGAGLGAGIVSAAAKICCLVTGATGPSTTLFIAIAGGIGAVWGIGRMAP